MSAREWKPGDVAIAAHPLMDAEVRGIIDTDGRFYTTDQSVKGLSSSCFALGNLRPVVVIDPEDREAVERLAQLFVYRYDTSEETNDMQAALREFANPTPPRPDEPTGLGAVVEDREGVQYVRVQLAYSSPWVRRGVVDERVLCKWSEIAVARVLSEGVTEDES